MAPARSRRRHPHSRRRLGRPYLSVLAALGLLASASTAVTACSPSCDTALTATSGTAHRTGNGAVAAQIQLDLSATLTSGGKGVGGVRIAFVGTLPDGKPADAAGAVTDAAGVAHYSGPADYELAHALTSATTPQTISYVAQTMTLGSTPNAGVCNLLTTHSQPADLHYQP